MSLWQLLTGSKNFDWSQIRIGCGLPVYEVQCVVITSIPDIKSAYKSVCDC